MNLPYQPELPIHLLAACFNKTSASYKFYWLLAILKRVELGEANIRKQDLFAEMVSHAWFTVNYFHVSFGKQDKLQHAVQQIRQLESLTIDISQSSVYKALANTTNKNTLKELQYFNAEVPHRFLSPWFRADNMNQAYQLSGSFTNNCPYALFKEHIEVNLAWMDYFQKNVHVLKLFCYWNLVMYLQTKNPNVPDLPNKLIKRAIRKNLTGQRKDFWDIVIRELGSVDCIYTNKRLEVGGYAVEHFIPHAFVAHDLIWNLIPADRAFNSTKSDKLPLLDQHFDPFFTLQQSAVEIMLNKFPKNRFLEDYLTLFPSLDRAGLTRQKFLEQVQPLVTIASNNGFEFL
jgi:hypothetical protein